jgi:tRNA(Ile)-lysidine synthase
VTLLDRIRRFARDQRLWQSHTRIIAAVSGGSDSVGMLLLLHDLHQRGDLVLVSVAHLNHGIRQEAGADEAFCRVLAERLDLPFVSSTVDVPSLGRERHQSIEVAGRLERRRILEAVRHSHNADVIATGHTEDDQAETVILRLVRGTGRRGLSGIAPSRGRLVRPVLAVTRGELRDELRRRGQSWRDDDTNLDLTNPRNRVRHEVLPYLARHFNPAVRRSLARVAGLARSDETLLARQSAAAAVHVVRLADDSARLDRLALTTLPEAVARRVVLFALGAVRPDTVGALEHVNLVLEVAAGRRRSADLPGVAVEHSGESVVLVRKDLRRAPAAPFQADLPIPGEVRLLEAGVVLEAEGPYAVGDPCLAAPLLVDSTDPGPINRGTVHIAADQLGSALVVRSRRPGDRLRPLGLGGRKKVQDLLVDRKVSRSERDRVPIVTDADGRIVWVAGHAIGEEFRVTDRTNAVIILKLRHISRVGNRRNSAPDR